MFVFFHFLSDGNDRGNETLIGREGLFRFVFAKINVSNIYMHAEHHSCSVDITIW